MNEQSFFRFLSGLRDQLQDDRSRAVFDQRFLNRRKTPVILYGFSFFLGWLGVDRFLLGHWGRGLGKLIIAGILPMWADMASTGYDPNPALQLFQLGVIWQIVDWFLIGGATRDSNRQLAQEIADGMAIGRESA